MSKLEGKPNFINIFNNNLFDKLLQLLSLEFVHAKNY